MLRAVFYVLSPLVFYAAVTRCSPRQGALLIVAWIALRALEPLLKATPAQRWDVLKLPAVGAAFAIVAGLVIVQLNSANTTLGVAIVKLNSANTTLGVVIVQLNSTEQSFGGRIVGLRSTCPTAPRVGAADRHGQIGASRLRPKVRGKQTPVQLVLRALRAQSMPVGHSSSTRQRDVS